MNPYEKAAEMILESKSTVMLTGAGISTDSGIPDFRSPGSGLWEKMDPMEVLSAQVLFDDPTIFYEKGFKLLLSMKEAMPNKAHYLVARLERIGLLDLLVTQNIDNLHIKAGSEKICEVHGNTRSCTCLSCNSGYPVEIMEKKVAIGEVPPKCQCGGILRPDVVLFGDRLPVSFNTAMEKVEKADLLIAAGTSLTVSPVNYLAAICKKLIIINIGETEYDYRADVVIREGITDTLGKIMEVIEQKNGKLQ